MPVVLNPIGSLIVRLQIPKYQQFPLLPYMEYLLNKLRAEPNSPCITYPPFRVVGVYINYKIYNCRVHMARMSSVCLVRMLRTFS